MIGCHFVRLQIEESSLDWGEIQEALVLLRLHKEKAGLLFKPDGDDEQGK